MPADARTRCRNGAEAARAVSARALGAGRRRRARAPRAAARAASSSRRNQKGGARRPREPRGSRPPPWRRWPFPRPWPRTARGACPRRATRWRARRWRPSTSGTSLRWPAKRTRSPRPRAARLLPSRRSIRSPSPTIRKRARPAAWAGARRGVEQVAVALLLVEAADRCRPRAHPRGCPGARGGPRSAPLAGDGGELVEGRAVPDEAHALGGT